MVEQTVAEFKRTKRDLQAVAGIQAQDLSWLLFQLSYILPVEATGIGAGSNYIFESLGRVNLRTYI